MSDCIRFFINGIYHEVAQVAPTTTILEYLREQANLTGSKEGCAEGDCGACTGVLIELQQDCYRLRSINTCIQFLPTLDGKELLTIEGLTQSDGTLHPIQRAMVNNHASQCGFCTPGFVMSLFPLYQSNAQPDRASIDHALSGNLCRCTGYRPIIDAAQAMYQGMRDANNIPNTHDWKQRPAAPERNWHPSEQEQVERLRSIARDQTLHINHRSCYFAPRKLDQLADLYVEHPQATLLAGGTDIGLWVTKQYRELPTQIYLGDVAELQQSQITDTQIEIGAAVNLNDAFAILNQHFPGLEELWRRFASPPICNAGTLVGNIANGSPIGDSMPALLCLDSQLLLRKGSQTRCLPLNEFYLGYQQNALQAGEFLVAVQIPRLAENQRISSYKLSKRFDQDISALCGAYSVVTNDGDEVEKIRIAYGGMAAIPSRALLTEQALLGRIWNEATVREAMSALNQDFSPIGDMRASTDYRRLAAANLLLKFFHESNGPASVYELSAAS